MTASTAPPEGSFLATGRGKITLALLCLVTFLDVMDGAIVNARCRTSVRIWGSRCRTCSGWSAAI